jgi:hypothetical protein
MLFFDATDNQGKLDRSYRLYPILRRADLGANPFPPTACRRCAGGE